jgi:hypothetical protein
VNEKQEERMKRNLAPRVGGLMNDPDLIAAGVAAVLALVIALALRATGIA